LEKAMTNLTRFDPFGDLTRFDPFRNMDEFFVMPRLPVYRPTVPAELEMRIDLTEDDKVFYVKADLPGMKKEDIHIAIDGNEVSIDAEMKKETEVKKGESVLRSERYYGRWARTFTLANEVDESKADAKYADGVLMLTLPKKSGVPVKHIAVH
jgi:HSP20 family protein